MTKEDYYELLGVKRSATKEELGRAFKRLARKYHPDLNPGDKKAEERFKKISEAYAVLSDPEKRKRFDSLGHSAFGQGGPWGDRGVPPNIEDILREFNLGDIFGSMFGTAHRGGQSGRSSPFWSQQAPQAPARGKDVNYSMEIGFDDSLKGLNTTISVPKTVYENGAAQRRTERIQVKIPPGVTNGSRIRLAGKGEPSPAEGPPGNLYIITKVRSHPYFERKGDNLYLELPVTLGEAILGTRVEIHTFGGTTKMTVPSGTQSGQTFRLSGLGAPRLKEGGNGDLYVSVNIRLPERVDEESKNLLREFEHRNAMRPRENMTGVSR